MTNNPVCIEILFTSVEQELARRWAYHNVPPLFANRPVLHLRLMVKVWWHLYHESVCARQQINRTGWHRHNSGVSSAVMNSEKLIEGLVSIYNQIDVEALLSFRPIAESERITLTLLTMIVAYYRDPTTQHFNRWLQIL